MKQKAPPPTKEQLDAFFSLSPNQQAKAFVKHFWDDYQYRCILYSAQTKAEPHRTVDDSWDDLTQVIVLREKVPLKNAIATIIDCLQTMPPNEAVIVMSTNKELKDKAARAVLAWMNGETKE